MNSDVLKRIASTFEPIEYIFAARAYGSYLLDAKSRDLDIALLLTEKSNIISSEVFAHIREMRDELCIETEIDVDLVPHTLDEVNDLRSPLHHPRHNPTLYFGINLKNTFAITPSATHNQSFSFCDWALFVLFENRTVCRRQLVRSLYPEEASIFLSKLKHGFGNALTYYVSKTNQQYLCNPSDIKKSASIFDSLYSTRSTRILTLIEQCKDVVSLGNATLLLQWYEHLIQVTMETPNSVQSYNSFCDSLSYK